MPTILPIAYLPSVAYVARIVRGGCVIDAGEHFVKRSQRNRASILAPDGPMMLTVQVAHANRPRTPVRSVAIDYSKRWQHLHWTAMVSYYRASPYFDYYAPRFERFYTERWERLADYDLALLQTMLDCIGYSLPPVSETYVEASPDDIDLRPAGAEDPAFRAEPYVQVFSDRLPFTGGLSFADLLFCEGPDSAGVLRECLR